MLIQSFWAIAAAASFSIMAAFVKLSNSMFGPLELVFYRSAFTTVAILAIVWMKGYSLKTNKIRWHLTRDTLGLLSVGIWFFTLGKLPLGTNITLTYTTSLFLAANFIILAFLRRQSPQWGAIIAILLGFVGVVTIMQPAFREGDEIPAMLCLSVALIDLGVYWCVRHLGSIGEPSWRIVFYFSVFCTVVTFFATLLLEDGFHIPSLRAGLCILAIGLFATLGLLTSARAWIGGNMLLVSCLGFSAIPFSELISIAVFDHIPSPLTLTGMCLILCAGIAATIFTKRQENREYDGKSSKAEVR